MSVKGSMITAKNDEKVITRNSSSFKRLVRSETNSRSMSESDHTEAELNLSEQNRSPSCLC